MKKIFCILLITSTLLSMEKKTVTPILTEESLELLKVINKCEPETTLKAVHDLLQKGADIEAKTSWGLTPFRIALQRGCINLANYLIVRGANINAQDKDGDTTLTYLANQQDFNFFKSGYFRSSKISSGINYLIEYLVEHGADVTLKNQSGKTAFNLADELFTLFSSLKSASLNSQGTKINVQGETAKLKDRKNYLQLVTDYYQAKNNNKLFEFLKKLYEKVQAETDKTSKNEQAEAMDNLFAIALNVGTEDDRKAFYELDKAYKTHFDDKIFQLELAEEHDFYKPVIRIFEEINKIDKATMSYIIGKSEKNPETSKLSKENVELIKNLYKKAETDDSRLFRQAIVSLSK